MADFTVIETQEQLDRVIGERIRRAEEKAAEKYSDYEAVKQQNETLASQIAQLTEQLRTSTEAIDGHKSTIDQMTAKVHAYEIASVKTRVALELGIPYQMADRLNGDSEEEIREDAKLMKGCFGSTQPVAPLGSGEPTMGAADPEVVAKTKFTNWLNNQNA